MAVFIKINRTFYKETGDIYGSFDLGGAKTDLC